MQQMNSNELSNLSPKALKEYITAYNLPFKTAIEKSDLVRIIFNTRPISNESEKHYRNCRSKQPSPSSTSNNDNNSFSFSNIMQDLFTPPPVPSPPPNQQRRQQEQARVNQQLHEEHMRRHQEQVRSHQQQQQQHREEHLRRVREQQQRQAAQTPPPRNTPTPTQRTSPPLSNENLLSLHDLVEAKIDPSSLSVRTLKSILKANFVEQSHVIEKSELVKLVVRLADQHRAEMESDKKNEEGGSNEDNLCRICFDSQQNCVFLDCGHMVTCMECAKKLIDSKNECPICREPILKLVHVFRS